MTRIIFHLPCQNRQKVTEKSEITYKVKLSQQAFRPHPVYSTMIVIGTTITNSVAKPMLHMMNRVSPAPLSTPTKVKYMASNEMNSAIIRMTTTPISNKSW